MKLFSLIALCVLSVNVFATELDPQTAPAEIVVREDAQGNREVFTVSESMNVADAASAEAVVATYVEKAAPLAGIVAESELDRTTSKNSWYYWYGNFNWGYNWNWGYTYNCYGYNYYYRPYYSYNYGYYNYYYYRWF
jgi:hypothetical protein